MTIWRLPQRAKLAAKHSVQHYTHKSIFVNIFFLHVFEELRTCASPLWPLVAGIWSNSACLLLNMYNFCLFHCFGGMLCAIIECLVAFLLLCHCWCLCACATFLNLVTCWLLFEHIFSLNISLDRFFRSLFVVSVLFSCSLIIWAATNANICIRFMKALCWQPNKNKKNSSASR